MSSCSFGKMFVVTNSQVWLGNIAKFDSFRRVVMLFYPMVLMLDILVFAWIIYLILEKDERSDAVVFIGAQIQSVRDRDLDYTANINPPMH